jgi:uncharacterized membrane protein (Fun14 family)
VGKIIIIGIMVVIALVLFPFLHWGVINIDTTGFLPLLASMTSLTPYAFMVCVAYVVLNIKE